MKSANQTTLTMLLTAAVSLAVAMYFIPWPEVIEVDEEVGKPLFEEYPVDQVRGINIIELDRDNRTLDRIQLVRKAEKWVVPSRQDFIATNSPLIGTVVNSLNDRTVHDVISENLEDHIQFGVVDPAEFTTEMNPRSIGRKLVLTDRNRKTIASLIVGSEVKDDSQKRYVRVPGKPRVYMIDYSDQILKTQFAFWVSPNVLQLKSQAGPGREIRSLTIENYSVNKNDVGAGRQSVYTARIQPIANRLAVESLKVPVEGNSDRWKKLRTTPQQEVALTNSVRAVYLLLTDNVSRKKKPAGKALKNPSAETDKNVFSDFGSYGFYNPEFKGGRWNFEADNGQVTVTTTEGVLTTISIGSQLGPPNSAGKGKLNHIVMINSGIDYSLLREPPRPAGLKDDDSDENKQHRRAVEGWKKALKNAKQLAADLNAVSGDWFYFISEDIINNLRPEIPIPVLSENTNPSDAAENPPVIRESEETEDISSSDPPDDK